MRSRLLRAVLLSALLAGPISGCRSDSDVHPATVPVQGKVIYNGQPVPKGTITFQSDAGDAATGELQADGTYQLSTFGQKDGAVPGHHKVMIIANDADPTLMPGSSPGYKPPKDLVPKKYGQFDTSGLSADVTKDKKTYNFDLK